MENIKTISDLTFSLSLNDNQEIEINNSGVSEKITIGQLKTHIASNKANIDGSNINENFFTGANFTSDTIDYIVESGSNAYGYYKKYKSGKTIQGANKMYGGTLGSGMGSQVVITLPTPTQSTNYIVNVNLDSSFTHYASIGYAVINKTTTGFQIDQYNITNGTSGEIYYNYSIIEF